VRVGGGGRGGGGGSSRGEERRGEPQELDAHGDAQRKEVVGLE
jgi:hypothetical protein